MLRLLLPLLLLATAVPASAQMEYLQRGDHAVGGSVGYFVSRDYVGPVFGGAFMLGSDIEVGGSYAIGRPRAAAEQLLGVESFAGVGLYAAALPWRQSIDTFFSTRITVAFAGSALTNRRGEVARAGAASMGVDLSRGWSEDQAASIRLRLGLATSVPVSPVLAFEDTNVTGAMGVGTLIRITPDLLLVFEPALSLSRQGLAGVVSVSVTLPFFSMDRTVE
jgi:hypothetical protein